MNKKTLLAFCAQTVCYSSFQNTTSDTHVYHDLCLIFQYLGRTHNLWYRSCLLLEQISYENGPATSLKSRSEYEFEPSSTQIHVSYYMNQNIDFVGEVQYSGFAQAWKVLEYTGLSWKVLEN